MVATTVAGSAGLSASAVTRNSAPTGHGWARSSGPDSFEDIVLFDVYNEAICIYSVETRERIIDVGTATATADHLLRAS